MKRRSGFIIMMRLIGLVKPLIFTFLGAVIFGTLGHLVAISIPVMGIYLVMYEGNKGILITMLVLAGVFRGIFRYIEQALNHDLAFKVLAKLRHIVFVKLRELSPAKLETKDRGDLIALITSDIELLEVFYAHTLSPIMIAMIVNGMVVYLLINFNILLGLVSLVSYILVGVVLPMLFSKKGSDSGVDYRNNIGKVNSFVLDSVRGIKDILQFNHGEKRLTEMKNLSEDLNQCQRSMMKTNALNTLIMESVILFSLLIYVYLGLQGKLPILAVLVVLVLHTSSFGPVISLGNLAGNMHHTFASGNRLLNLLDEEPVVKDVVSDEVIEFEEANFESVNFAYSDQDILKDINIVIKKNDIVAIEGESGVGKSTLIKLLMRFWEPQSGTINISNENINTIDTNNLRSIEGLMGQTTDMFQDTILNNISLSNPKYSLKDIQGACKKASIHDFIMTLDKGYDTLVGDEGSTLSSGEKQRIGLARVFLHDADLILLDEPTSNLDSLNEAVVLKTLVQHAKEKTILVASHRPSTLKIATRHFEMNNGVLEENK